MFKEYIDYLKDNPEGYWFKRKLYGWGWTPATWQGWVSTAVFLIVYVGYAFVSATLTKSLGPANPYFVAPLAIIFFIFLFVVYKKGERPAWQWGKQKRKQSY